MSNFTPKVKFTTEFDGDKISMELSRLRREHVAKIAPYMKGVDDEGNAVVEFSNQVEFSNMMVDIIPSCVTNFVGLTDASGTPMTLEYAIDQTYFSDLVGRIMSELFSISKPKKEELKELKKSPSDISEGSMSILPEASKLLQD